MILNVKVYFANKEVRRYRLLAESIESLFRQLQERISATIDLSSGCGYSLVYRDNEEEEITFSTAEEFGLAKELLTEGDLLRIYVKEKSVVETKDVASCASLKQDVPDAALDTSVNNGNNRERSRPVWHGVQCDGCLATPLTGIRHKCKECWDFDLCSTCFKSVGHSHPMHALDSKKGARNLCGRGNGKARCRNGNMAFPFGYAPMGDFYSVFAPPNDGKSAENKKKSTLPDEAPKIEVDLNLNKSLEENLGVVRSNLQNVAKMFQSMATGGASLEGKPAEPTAEVPVTVKNVVNEAKLAEEVSEMNDTMVSSAATVETVGENEDANSDGWQILQPDNLQACVKNLSQMGFDVEQDWMKQLIKAYDGDIQKVLDALHPNGTNVYPKLD